MEHLLIQRSSKYLTSHNVQIQRVTPLSFNLNHSAAFSTQGDEEGIVNIHSSALLPLYLVGLSCVEETVNSVFASNLFFFFFNFSEQFSSGLLNP